MTINQSGWKPAAPVAGSGDTGTVTGNRALMLEEPLIFEIGDTGTTGVDFADPPRNGEDLLPRISALLKARPMATTIDELESRRQHFLHDLHDVCTTAIFGRHRFHVPAGVIDDSVEPTGFQCAENGGVDVGPREQAGRTVSWARWIDPNSKQIGRASCRERV